MKRRHFLRASAASALVLTATPRLVLADCDQPRTAPNIEGPFYKAGAPWRGNLARGPLQITGFVRDRRCQPVEGAVVEIWQADADGAYDLEGYRFRGRVRTEGQYGSFVVQTVHPGHYRNGPTYRPAHIHVKVHANDHPPLTTQLYFPHDRYNDSDPWFRSDLLLRNQPYGCHPRPGRRMQFTFRL